MRAYQKFYKSYAVWTRDLEKTRKLGEYTTVDGCHAAMKRRGITDYTITPINWKPENNA